MIGVLESSASFAGQIVTSQETLEGLADRAVPPQTYYFDLGNDANAAATAKTLEKDFAESGLQTQVTARSSATPTLRGDRFLLCGDSRASRLVVGICTLGVIAPPVPVVERRQQIGMMRALGVPEGAGAVGLPDRVLLICALLGIGVGVALGLGFSGTLVDISAKAFQAWSAGCPGARCC